MAKYRSSFVSNHDEYQKYIATVKQVVDTNRRLPDQVFKSGFHYYLFHEYDWMTWGDFWQSLKPLSKSDDDERIIVAGIAPDPQDYYHQHFGDYNAFSISASASVEDYQNMLTAEPSGSPADAMNHHTDLIVLAPSSCTWAVWAEHELGVCVLACKIDQQRVSAIECGWEPVESTIETFLRNEFRGDVVPDDIAIPLRANYSNH